MCSFVLRCDFSYEVQGVEVVWAVKDTSITHTFIDSGAAAFFLPHLASERENSAGPVKRHKYQLDGEYQSMSSRLNVRVCHSVM